MDGSTVKFDSEKFTRMFGGKSNLRKKHITVAYYDDDGDISILHSDIYGDTLIELQDAFYDNEISSIKSIIIETINGDISDFETISVENVPAFLEKWNLEF